jgi:transposase-like protein
LNPIDFSEKSEYASKNGSKIAAKNSKSIVYLLHLIDLPTGAIDIIKKYYSIPESMLYLRKKNFEFKENFSKQQKFIIQYSFKKSHQGILKYAEKN